MYELPEGNTCNDCAHFDRCMKSAELNITKDTIICQLGAKAKTVSGSMFLLDAHKAKDKPDKDNPGKTPPKKEKPKLNAVQAAKRLEVLEKRIAKSDGDMTEAKAELKIARKELDDAVTAHKNMRIKLEERSKSPSGGAPARVRRTTAQRQADLDAHNASKPT